MHLAISGFGSPHHLAVWILFAGFVVICLLTEVFSRLLLNTSSMTQQRIDAQMPAVLRLRHREGAETSILLVGNSVMVYAINPHILKTDLSIKCEIAPLFIEATSYYDWYYGLRRIFAEGAEPDVVIVALPATTFLETQVRSDYFSSTLLDRRDVPRLSRDLKYNWTKMASLFVGTLSSFWGHRGVIRARVLSVFSSDSKLRGLARDRPPKSTMTEAQIDRELRNVASYRLVALAALCADHKARLVILLPPVASRNDHFKTFFEIASAAEAEVLLPISSETLRPRDFPDGAHLGSNLVDNFTHSTVLAIRGLLECRGRENPPLKRADGPVAPE
jgi:hypothetical protein